MAVVGGPIADRLRNVDEEKAAQAARRRRLSWKLARLEAVIPAGPFTGMPYIREACGSLLTPKLIGTYEIELWDAVERAISDSPGLVVDIGAAEGYYAVGLARRMPAVRVIAYEMSDDGRKMLAGLAARSGVASRLTIKGECTPSELEAIRPDCRVLVICDCEGVESVLLDPARVPWLAEASLIIETHDHLFAGVSDALRSRFERTHEVIRIEPRPRTVADVGPRFAFTEWEVGRVARERSPDNPGWLIMRPLAAPPA